MKIQCIIQYRLKMETIIELYTSAWREMHLLERDMMTQIKDIVQSVANTYGHNDFIIKRGDIEKEISYKIGKIFKDKYYSQLGYFLMNRIDLEQTHLNSYLQTVITAQQSKTTTELNAVNLILADIDTVKANAASEVATINQDSIVDSETAKNTLKVQGDQAFITAFKTASTALKTELGADDDQYLSFNYLDDVMNGKSSDKINYNFDIF